jgi:hypothetical protein
MEAAMSEQVPIILSDVDIAHAKLPEVYKTARQAIAQCVEIDECAQWADKAVQLAAYARMAQDETLLRDAMRIQADAVRRMGDLIKLIPAQMGGRPPAGTKTKAAGGPSFSPRQQAINAAGVSERQAKTALRVSNVPQDSFDAQMGAANPPTVTELARQGTQHRPPSATEPEEESEARLFGRKLIQQSVEVLRLMTPQERSDFRRDWIAAVGDAMVQIGKQAGEAS